MGISPEDLLAPTRPDRPIPTFTEYIPVVAKAVGTSSHILWSGIDHHDRAELADANTAAALADNNWPVQETYIPALKRNRHAFGTCPTHAGADENAVREIGQSVTR
jgi:hypothetical protein